MMLALVFTWGIRLGYDYTPQSRLWLESGGVPRFGWAPVTAYRPVFVARISW